MSEQIGQEQSVEAASTQENQGPIVDQNGVQVDVASTVEEVAAKTEDTQPETQKQDDRLSSKFAALSRKEKQLRERERALEQRLRSIEEQYKTKEQEVTSKYISPERFKKEPLKVLEEVGLNFNQLAEMIVNDGKPTAEMQAAELENKITAKIKELEEKLAEKEAKEQEAKYEQTLQQFVGEITGFVNTNNEYELIRANDSVDLVYDVIEEYHANNGIILSIKEACDAVEGYLLEEAKKQLSLGKVKGLIAPKTEPQAPVIPKGRASVTLSNAVAAQAPKSGNRFLSDEESKAEAAKLIRWEE